MSSTAILRSEWIKIRSVRATFGSLLAILVVSAGIGALISAGAGTGEAGGPDHDPVLFSFSGINFGQIAAIAFGATAFSTEFHHGALRVSLTAVPRRTHFYAAKTATVAGAALAVGLVTGFATFFAGQTGMGSYAIGLDDPGALRATVGAGVYLALMAVLAAGLAALLRSGVLVMSLLIPFILIVSFVIGDMKSAVADFLPDRAGQIALHQYPDAAIGPWTGLAVTAAWAAAAVLAGWLAVGRRDA
ncbi:ABC transporter permease [Streptomyces sp. SID3212]|uniref:ABC transporter permease n=1 Tax=Streptomyces sp. SID3212 TaxID=2690259 RepID=UPI001928307D|nr:ABC transporter permease [Streptomyces sp. SID3212]